MTLARTLKHSLLGLVVMILVGMVPMVNLLAPFVGGGTAGYLQREGARGGAVAGGLVGALMGLLALSLLLVATLVRFVTTAGAGLLDWLPAAGGGAWVVLLFVGMTAGMVLFSAVGGVLGGLVEADQREPPAPETPS